jgi:hypothetical protein
MVGGTVERFRGALKQLNLNQLYQKVNFEHVALVFARIRSGQPLLFVSIIHNLLIPFLKVNTQVKPDNLHTYQFLIIS